MKAMKRITVFLLSGLYLLYLLSPVYAAEEETESTVQGSNETATEESQEENDQAPNLPAEDGLTRPEDENFIPSVRITEDLPVAFPVDI